MSIGRNCVSMEMNLSDTASYMRSHFCVKACNDCNVNGMSEQHQGVNQAFIEDLLGWPHAVGKWCCREKTPEG